MIATVPNHASHACESLDDAHERCGPIGCSRFLDAGLASDPPGHRPSWPIHGGAHQHWHRLDLHARPSSANRPDLRATLRAGVE